ncbi:response regulator transcription factor [Brevundimonas nasdae]|jgi:DNA-binding response OmpR family regulator|uniref:Response regulator transcription factor n=1 Tax=Brevundimonas nasdae TaxID=172043 RepID=A0ABX8TEH1_9CAUL|nr:response regulator transcription factor [Brevundimonas nasdae]QYC09590.1 response regulator transcription factor [Brevundimonas nasdae]QYC15639.1 response regulator transcription factor [Brevundimonas nasdae]
MKIAVLDDDPVQLAAITAVAEDAGYRATGFSRSGALLSALRRDTFDLLVLDWNLPDRSGLEVIGWVRLNVDPPPPMLLVTSRTEDADIVAGLEAGADDYLAKPISPPVLAARIAALLRRAYPGRADGGIETHAGLSFDPSMSAVVVRGEAVTLTAREFSLALVLFRNLHRALSRSYLSESAWGSDPDLNSRSLDMHVSRVRAKLGLRPQNGFRLTPVYSYGYRLERVAGAERTTPLKDDET